MICHYQYFNHGFNFQKSVCNGCYDLIMLSVNISDIAVNTVKSADYHCIIYNISKSEAIYIFENYLLHDRETIQKNIVLILCLFKQGFF